MMGGEEIRHVFFDFFVCFFAQAPEIRAPACLRSHAPILVT
jgi:hypothetical protein